MDWTDGQWQKYSSDVIVLSDHSDVYKRQGYNSIPNCYALLDMEAMNETGISVLQNYPGLNLRGKGIMIGFLDTGIDYENEIFRNIDGSSRITAIWDQTDQNGQPPDTFTYGSEYTNNQINQALKSDNPKEIVPVLSLIHIYSTYRGRDDTSEKSIRRSCESGK